MGGLAIKNAFTRRYQKDEFEALVPEVVAKAKDLFTDVHITEAYFQKDSFGDMDVLCLVDKPIDVNIKDWIYEKFDSKEVVSNNSVYSFEYKELQIDFILTPLRNWETSKVYFSFNDLHNFIGKHAKKFGLKWGFKGLEYDYKIGDKKLGTINITKDYTKALDFLGFDVERYNKGFETLEDIFKFVIDSKYFNPFMYDLEQYNKINRDRDKKRKTYQSFLKYLEPYKNQALMDQWSDKNKKYHYFYKDKKVYLGLIDHYFPGFLEQYRELEKKEEKLVAIRAKFNGNILMDEFGLEGKELGQSISNFKASFENNNEFEGYVLKNDVETILNEFKTRNKL